MNPLELLPVRKLRGDRGELILVDGDYDGEYFAQFRWHVMPNGYVVATGQTSLPVHDEKTGVMLGPEKGPMVYLHRLVLTPKPGYWVKHLNGNLLDNRSANLGYITPFDSALTRKLGKRRKPGEPLASTSSSYTGVRRSSNSVGGKRFVSENRWTVQCAGAYIASFGSAEEAAQAYDSVALQVYGDRARLNFKGE